MTKIDGHYSKDLSDKIQQFAENMDGHPTAPARIIQGIASLGPSCFFQSLENEEQAKGAIALLDWLEAHLKD